MKEKKIKHGIYEDKGSIINDKIDLDNVYMTAIKAKLAMLSEFSKQ
jgi:hypothetical protein